MLQLSEMMDGQVFDAEALRESYRTTSSEELAAIVTVDSGDYIEEALELARAELESRGVESKELSDFDLELRAQRYDELMVAKQADAPLPGWMFWFCLLDPSGLSIWILIYLGCKGRGRAFKSAALTILVGWFLKGILFTSFALIIPNLLAATR